MSPAATATPNRTRTNPPKRRLAAAAGATAHELVPVAEVPRPTVAQLMRMHPSMERFADSPRLQFFLPLSGFL